MNDHAESLLDYFSDRTQKLELHQAGALFAVREHVAFHQRYFAWKPVFRMQYAIDATFTHAFTSIM
jgi:hypothetical protein